MLEFERGRSRATTRSASASSSAAGVTRIGSPWPSSLHSVLSNSFGLLRDQRVGRAQDAHRRAIVLLELDHLQRRIVARQLREIVERRAAPAVDRLVVVADRGERARARRPGAAAAGTAPGWCPGIRRPADARSARASARAAPASRSSSGDRQRDQIVEVDRLVGATARRRSAHRRAPRRLPPRRRRRRQRLRPARPARSSTR